MNEQSRYMISDAAKMVGVEAHVLRYWEEQLHIAVPRNEMGHRYYTEEQLTYFKKIKKLKDRGFGLRAVSSILWQGTEEKGHEGIESREAEQLAEITKELSGEEMEKEGKIRALPSWQAAKSSDAVPAGAGMDEAGQGILQFKTIMGEIILQAMKDNSATLGEEIGKQLEGQMSRKMDELARREEAREEARYRRLDETIRRVQRNRAEAAALAAATGSGAANAFAAPPCNSYCDNVQEAENHLDGTEHAKGHDGGRGASAQSLQKAETEELSSAAAAATVAPAPDRDQNKGEKETTEHCLRIVPDKVQSAPVNIAQHQKQKVQSMKQLKKRQRLIQKQAEEQRKRVVKQQRVAAKQREKVRKVEQKQKEQARREAAKRSEREARQERKKTGGTGLFKKPMFRLLKGKEVKGKQPESSAQIPTK